MSPAPWLEPESAATFCLPASPDVVFVFLALALPTSRPASGALTVTVMLVTGDIHGLKVSTSSQIAMSLDALLLPCRHSLHDCCNRCCQAVLVHPGLIQPTLGQRLFLLRLLGWLLAVGGTIGAR